jgi:hypothetical protein
LGGLINYTVPALQFLIGGFEASQYLDSISLSVPMHEPGQALLWTGRFKISNNLKARANGLTEADFSEYGNPARWRPYQQVVRLNIKGYQSPALRIENYRYNPQTNSGEGILTQIPMAVAGDRPGVQISTTVSGSIGGAIERLLTAAFGDATVHPTHLLNGDSGVLDVPLVTRNPWVDAVRLAGLSWHWLAVDRYESIVSVDGVGGGLAFTRTLEQVELVPDLAAIYQSAQEVIVTGARQVEDRQAAATAAVAAVRTAPRPKVKTTNEYRPAGAVFPSSGSSTTPTLFEEKTIYYQYWDDDSLPLLSGLTGFLFDIQSQTQTGINPGGIPPIDLNVPMQTITIKRQPKGFLFPSLAPDATLTDAEVIIESNLRRLILKPLGVLFPASGTDVTLAIEKRETLTSQLIPPGTQLTPNQVDANGAIAKYEPRPVLEAQQPVATRPLKTEALKGKARITPVGWTPVLDKLLVVDFGFLPDNARAEFLAHRIAEREQWRRDQVLVDLPIPDEWLAGGWPLLRRCQVGNDIYLMDGCAVAISDGEAKFGFTGALISKGSSVLVNGVPTIVQQPLHQAVISVGADVIFDMVVTIEVAIAAVVPANNNFANRITIVGQSATVTGNNANATTEVDEPLHAEISNSHSLWWSWTAPTSEFVSIDCFGSDFDTILAVYTGTSVNGLTTLSYNTSGSVGIYPDAGTTYQIAVSGYPAYYYQAQTGNIILNLNQQI